MFSMMDRLFVLICSFIVVSHSQECGKQLIQADGTTTCYNIVFAGGSWSVAAQQCIARGPTSRLPVVSTPEQNSAIAALLQENGLTESWLAASETTHAWQWLDGTNVHYQGCYKDNSNSRDLDVMISLPGDNSPSRCVAECSARSYAYAGLQNGEECWCGNHFGRYGQTNAVCDSSCPADNSLFCGGRSYALDVFAVSSNSLSNWSHGQPYNPTGDTNCAVLEKRQDRVEWMDYACSRSDFGALCDLGPGTATECSGRSSTSFVVGDRCVDVISDVMTQFEARTACRGHGATADLVQLKTDSDNTQAEAGLRNYLNSAQQASPSGFWIGLVRSTWSWRSGRELTFTNWEVGMPSGVTTSHQQCLLLSLDVNGRWKNVDCNLTKPFVCEDVNSTVPVKSTTTTIRTTTTTAGIQQSGRTASLSSALSYSAVTIKSIQTTQVDESGNSGVTGLPLEILIAIICGGAGLLVITVVIIVVAVVVCRRKRGKSCCCCGSDPEARRSNKELVRSPTDCKPRYYFGVTAEDLRQANEAPVNNDDFVIYSSITTPPPDVVPPNAPDTENSATNQTDPIYADCVTANSTVDL